MKENPRPLPVWGFPTRGAAGNRTRVLRHFARASPCAVRTGISTRLSGSGKHVRMMSPVSGKMSDSPPPTRENPKPLSRCRQPGQRQTRADRLGSRLKQRVRSRAEYSRRLIKCYDAHGGRCLHRHASPGLTNEVETKSQPRLTCSGIVHLLQEVQRYPLTAYSSSHSSSHFFNTTAWLISRSFAANTSVTSPSETSF